MREDRSTQWEVESNPPNPPVLFRDVWLFSAPEEAVLAGEVEGDWGSDMREADKINNNNKSSYGGETGLLTEESLEVVKSKEDCGPGSEAGVVGSLMEGESVVSSVGFNILEEAGIFLEDEVNQCLKQEEEERKTETKAEADATVASWSPDIEEDDRKWDGKERVGSQKGSKYSGGRRSRKRKGEEPEIKRCHPNLIHSFRPFDKSKFVLTNPGTDSETDTETTGDSGVSPGKRPLGWHFDGEEFIFYDSVRKKDQQKIIDGILEDDKKGISFLQKPCKVGKTKKRSNDSHESLGVEDDTDSSVSSFYSADSLFRPIKRKRRPVKRSKFSCTVCVRSFTNLEDLQVHQRVHSQEKPYSCKNCGNGFIAASYLEYHQKNSECSNKIDSTSSMIPSTSASSQLQLAQAKMKFEGLKEVRIVLTRLPMESYPKSYFKDKLQLDKDEGNKDLKLMGDEILEKTERAVTLPKSKLSFVCPYCQTFFEDASELIEHLPFHDSIGPELSNSTVNTLKTEIRRRSRKQLVRSIKNDEDDVINWKDERNSKKGRNGQRSTIRNKKFKINVQDRLAQLPLQFDMDTLSSESESEVIQPQDFSYKEIGVITKRPPKPIVHAGKRQRPHRQQKLKDLSAMPNEIQESIKEKLQTAQRKRDLVGSDSDEWLPHNQTSLFHKTQVKGVVQKVNRINASRNRNGVREKFFECTICGMQFSRGDGLKKHFDRLHSGGSTRKNGKDVPRIKLKLTRVGGVKVGSEYREKPYKCNACSKTFGSKGGLHYHLKVHHPNDNHRNGYVNFRNQQIPQETLSVTYGPLKVSVPPCEVRLVRCDYLLT